MLALFLIQHPSALHPCPSLFLSVSPISSPPFLLHHSLFSIILSPEDVFCVSFSLFVFFFSLSYTVASWVQPNLSHPLSLCLPVSVLVCMLTQHLPPPYTSPSLSSLVFILRSILNGDSMIVTGVINMLPEWEEGGQRRNGMSRRSEMKSSKQKKWQRRKMKGRRMWQWYTYMRVGYVEIYVDDGNKSWLNKKKLKPEGGKGGPKKEKKKTIYIEQWWTRLKKRLEQVCVFCVIGPSSGFSWPDITYYYCLWCTHTHTQAHKTKQRV